ncbi:cytosol aminopeptidase [Hyphomonas neptunium ATCC 15444]|uniref:Probable cytosol aminopeptidase n=2 Tax=Hyphomonas TaxID=85 RepID=Q0C004_HYPNA|nr:MULTISPECIES: leucyl aminopeptidase [Hyphomonas]ABI78648.1 cytosol aminopeptidase [Hyphomonas neptunium ATCC 15444]KCZ86628.1 cytosol aminopeptidase [Hyphomonas hirschiana VP5]
MKTWFTAAVSVLALALPAAADLPAIEFAKAERPNKGAVVLPVGKDGALEGLSRDADRAAKGAIAEAITMASFKGEAGQTLTLYGVGPYSGVLLVGTGAGLKSATDMQTYGATVGKGTSAWKANVTVVVPDAADVTHDAAIAAQGAMLGAYDFGKWRSEPAAATEPTVTLTFLAPDAGAARRAWESNARAVAEGVYFARDLISTPSNIKTPAWFADQVVAKFDGVPNVSVTVLDETQIEALGMGALYGTGQGSARPPRLVAVEYKGGAAGDAPLAFVGKGITFDTGGISIKPSANMWRMRMDMSGAAASAGAVLTLAKREAKLNAVAVLALAENMPDGNAIRPGDVLTSMSGKTIEIMSTDAEGRLVLADGLWWAQEQYKPKMAVTIATLTGAVVGALGPDYAGLFTKDDKLAGTFLAAAESSGEALWRMPVHPNSRKALNSDVADLKNGGEGAPGASVGAAFVMEWAKEETPFVHLDIAGVAWQNAGNAVDPKGAVGYGVRLFDEVARTYESK